MPEEKYVSNVYKTLKENYPNEFTTKPEVFEKAMASDTAYAKNVYGQLKELYPEDFKTTEENFIKAVGTKQSDPYAPKPVTFGTTTSVSPIIPEKPKQRDFTQLKALQVQNEKWTNEKKVMAAHIDNMKESLDYTNPNQQSMFGQTTGNNKREVDSYEQSLDQMTTSVKENNDKQIAILTKVFDKDIKPNYKQFVGRAGYGGIEVPNAGMVQEYTDNLMKEMGVDNADDNKRDFIKNAANQYISSLNTYEKITPEAEKIFEKNTGKSMKTAMDEEQKKLYAPIIEIDKQYEAQSKMLPKMVDAQYQDEMAQIGKDAEHLNQQIKNEAAQVDQHFAEMGKQLQAASVNMNQQQYDAALNILNQQYKEAQSEKFDNYTMAFGAVVAQEAKINNQRKTDYAKQNQLNYNAYLAKRNAEMAKLSKDKGYSKEFQQQYEKAFNEAYAQHTKNVVNQLNKNQEEDNVPHVIAISAMKSMSSSLNNLAKSIGLRGLSDSLEKVESGIQMSPKQMGDALDDPNTFKNSTGLLDDIKINLKVTATDLFSKTGAATAGQIAGSGALGMAMAAGSAYMGNALGVSEGLTMATGGFISWAQETHDIKKGIYKQVYATTNDVQLAEQAADIGFDSQLYIMGLNMVQMAKFMPDAELLTNMVKNPILRRGAIIGAEQVSNTLEEYYQNAFENSVTDPLTAYQQKTFTDAGDYFTAKLFKQTALQTLPMMGQSAVITFFSGAGKGLSGIQKYRADKLQQMRADALLSSQIAQMGDNFGAQQLTQFYDVQGGAATITSITQLQAKGKITAEKATELVGALLNHDRHNIEAKKLSLQGSNLYAYTGLRQKQDELERDLLSAATEEEKATLNAKKGFIQGLITELTTKGTADIVLFRYKNGVQLTMTQAEATEVLMGEGAAQHIQDAGIEVIAMGKTEKPIQDIVSQIVANLSEKAAATTSDKKDIIALNEEHKQLSSDILNRQKELLNEGINDFSKDEKWNEINDRLKEIEKAAAATSDKNVTQTEPTSDNKPQTAEERAAAVLARVKRAPQTEKQKLEEELKTATDQEVRTNIGEQITLHETKAQHEQKLKDIEGNIANLSENGKVLENLAKINALAAEKTKTEESISDIDKQLKTKQNERETKAQKGRKKDVLNKGWHDLEEADRITVGGVGAKVDGVNKNLNGSVFSINYTMDDGTKGEARISGQDIVDENGKAVLLKMDNVIQSEKAAPQAETKPTEVKDKGVGSGVGGKEASTVVEGSGGVGGDVGWDKLPKGEAKTENTVKILKKSKGTIFENLADAIAPFVSKVKTLISNTDKVKSEGKYGDGKQYDGLYEDGVIKLGGETDLYHFFHEAIHATTVEKIKLFELYKLRDAERSKSSIENNVNLTETDIAAIDELNRIFEKVKGDSNQFAKEWFYGLTNVKEFVAEAFTNKEFQNYLKNKKSEGKESNLFKDFIAVISKVLGIKDKSILDDIFYHTEKLIEGDKAFEQSLPTQEQTTSDSNVIQSETKPTSDKKQTEISDVESTAKALDGEQVRSKLQEIEKQPVKINITQDSNGKMEQTSQEVINNIKSELDKIGLPYSDVVSNDKGSTYFVVTKDGQQHEILKVLQSGGKLVPTNLTKAKWINHLIKTEKDGVVKAVEALLSKEQTQSKAVEQSLKEQPKAGSVGVDIDFSKRKKEMQSEHDKLIKRKRELANDRDDVVTSEGKYKNFGKKERDARLEEIRNEVNNIDSKQEALQKELKVIEAKEKGSVELFDNYASHGSTNTILYDIKRNKLYERENITKGKTKEISIEDAAKQKFEKTQRGRNQREINEAYTDKVKAKYEAEINDEINKYKSVEQSLLPQEAKAEQPTVSGKEVGSGVGGDVEGTAKALEEVAKTKPTLWEKIKEAVKNVGKKLGIISNADHINNFNTAKAEWDKLSSREKKLKRADYELDDLHHTEGGYYKVGNSLIDLDLNSNHLKLLLENNKFLNVLNKLGVTKIHGENRPAEEMFAHYSDGKIHLNNNSAFENIRQVTNAMSHELGHHEWTKLTKEERDYVRSLPLETGMAKHYEAQEKSGKGKETSASLQEENFADYVMQYFQGKLYGDEALLNKIPAKLRELFDNKYSDLLKDNEYTEASEAYHKAKADGSNPELVKSVESLLSKEQPTSTTKSESNPALRDVENATKALPNYGKTVDTKMGKVDLVIEPNIESENKNSIKVSAYDADGNTLGFSSAVIDTKNKTLTVKVSQIKDKYQRNGIYSKIIEEYETIAKDKGLKLERELEGETKASKDFWNNRKKEGAVETKINEIAKKFKSVESELKGTIDVEKFSIQLKKRYDEINEQYGENKANEVLDSEAKRADKIIKEHIDSIFKRLKAEYFEKNGHAPTSVRDFKSGIKSGEYKIDDLPSYKDAAKAGIEFPQSESLLSKEQSKPTEVKDKVVGSGVGGDVEDTAKEIEKNPSIISNVSGDEYYHGTSLPKSEDDFTTANKDKGVGVRSNAFMGTSREQKSPFFFITSERGVANDFAQAKKEYHDDKVKPTEKHTSRIIPFKFDEKNSKVLDLTKDNYEFVLQDIGESPIDFFGMGMYEQDQMWEMLDEPKFAEKLKSLGYDAVKFIEPKRGIGIAVLNTDKIVNTTPKGVAEAYHKAKKDGTNPELVKAVEQSLPTQEQTTSDSNVILSENKGEGASDNIIQSESPTKRYEELIKAIDNLKKEYPKEFKKDGTPKSNSKILPSYKAMVDMAAQAYEDSYLERQAQRRKEAKVIADKKDTGIVDGMANIASNSNAAQLFKSAMSKGIFNESDYNQIGTELALLPKDENGQVDVGSVAEIISSYIDNVVRPEKNDAQKKETEAINKAFEERQSQLAKNLTSKEIQDNKEFDEINRIFNKVQNDETPTKKEIDYINQNAWLPKGFVFGKNGLQEGDGFDKAADATIEALNKLKIIDTKSTDKRMGMDGEKIIRAAFDASRVIYHASKSLAEAIKKALQTVRDSDWYKNLSGDQKSDIDNLVRAQLNAYAKENVVAEPLPELDWDMQDQDVKEQIIINAQNLIESEEFKDYKEFSLRLKELYGLKESDAKTIYDSLVEHINVQTEDPFSIALRGKGAVTDHMNNKTLNESSEDEIGNRTYLANSFAEMNEDIDAVFNRIRAANPKNWEKIIADKILERLDAREMQAAIFADRFVTFINNYLADHQRSPNYTEKAREYKKYRIEILRRRQKFTQEFATYFAKLQQLKLHNPLTMLTEQGLLDANQMKAAKEMDEQLKGKKEYDASGKPKPFVEDSKLDKAPPTSDKKEKETKKASKAEVKKNVLNALKNAKDNAADLAIKITKIPC